MGAGLAERAAIFGDVHGNAAPLRDLLAKIKDQYGDVDLYCTGDLIDRGPDSKGVLDLCIQHEVTSLVGNHDQWLHRLAKAGVFETFALHPVMGGKATLESYGCMWTGQALVEKHMAEVLPQSHRDYLLGMPIWIRIEVGGVHYRLTHAGLDSPTAAVYTAELDRAREEGKNVPETGEVEYGDELLRLVATVQPDNLLWTGCDLRNPNAFHFPDGSVQVFGHTPVGREPRITKRWIALDTGCGKRGGGSLSAVVLPEGDVVQAP